MKLEDLDRIRELRDSRSKGITWAQDALAAGDNLRLSIPTPRKERGFEDPTSELRLTGERLDRARDLVCDEVRARVAAVEAELRTLGIEFEPMDVGAKLEGKPAAKIRR